MIIVQDDLTSKLQDALEMFRRKDQDLGRLADFWFWTNDIMYER